MMAKLLNMLMPRRALGVIFAREGDVMQVLIIESFLQNPIRFCQAILTMGWHAESFRFSRPIFWGSLLFLRLMLGRKSEIVRRRKTYISTSQRVNAIL